MIHHDTDAIQQATSTRSDRTSALAQIADLFRQGMNSALQMATQSTANLVRCRQIAEAATAGQTSITLAEVERWQSEDAAAVAFFADPATQAFLTAILSWCALDSTEITTVIDNIQAAAAEKTQNWDK